MYTQYMFDKMLVNPAYVGSSNWIVGSLKYRTQFIGIQGAPQTQTFTAHAPWQKKHMGFGIKIYHDQLGVTTENRASLLYAYHLGFAGGKLSLGIEAGVVNQSVDFSTLIRENQTDNALPLARQSVIAPDANFGVYYQNKHFYGGFASYQLIPSKINYTGTTREPIAKLFTHSFLLLGYVIESGKKLNIDPSILVKQVSGAPVQLDANVNFIYNDLITLGVGYRSGDALVTTFRINIAEKLRIAYSYDYQISGLKSYSGGAHEIMLSYGIKLLPPPAEKEISPRYYF